MNISPLIDAHAHLLSLENTDLAQKEISFRRSLNLFTCFSCGTPEEWAQMNLLKALFREDPLGANFCLSFGIHPWYADRYNCCDHLEAYKASTFIGEIGLDSLWCEVPPETQARVFKEQLAIAKELKKPILLHTKDCEEAVYELIKDYPFAICIHWYSGDIDTLRKFIAKGCYFTFAPDTTSNEPRTGPVAERVKTMLKEVPLDRILVETDGIEAILWADGVESPSYSEEDFPLISNSLQRTLGSLAKAKGFPVNLLIEKIQRNFFQFIKESK